MDFILINLDFLNTYIKNVIVAFKIPKGQRNHLGELFWQLEHGIKINPGKYILRKEIAEGIGFPLKDSTYFPKIEGIYLCP